MENKKARISLIGLILMIFTSIYGFANTTVAFEQMGYASIVWYVFAAIIFFLPTGLMFAEYGSALKDSHGGFYSWLSFSVGDHIAFIGTFIWLASWVIWLVSTSSKIWIPLSTLISGHDATQSWFLFGLNSVQTIGILAVVWMIAVTFFTTRGINSVAKIGAVGGVFVMILTGVFFLASIIILIANHGVLEQPITGMKDFVVSPNPMFVTPIAIFSFVVYAIFAYGGMETMGGVVDDLDKPSINFPRGIIIATIIISIFYSLSIFFWGVSTNWTKVIGSGHVNLGNITYALMNNLGIFLGKSLHLAPSTSMAIGSSLARVAGLSMFLAYCGSFFIMTYSPIKSFILGSPKKLWPAKITKLNKKGMPATAMWIQCALICIVVLLIAFGGSGAQKFYQILTDMGNISTTVPYLFLIGAFPYFKKKMDLERPFEVYKNRTWTNVIVIFIMIILALGIIFTAVQPILSGDYMTAFWTVIGPVFFGFVAEAFYQYQSRNKQTTE